MKLSSNPKKLVTGGIASPLVTLPLDSDIATHGAGKTRKSSSWTSPLGRFGWNSLFWSSGVLTGANLEFLQTQFHTKAAPALESMADKIRETDVAQKLTG